MVSYYPAYIDTSATLPPFVDGQPVQAAPVERLRETIIAIEAELGIRPSGAYTTVRARLDALEALLAGIQVIQLNGDLGGTLASPKVIGIQGRPVSDAQPAFNQVLGWNGIAWVPTDQTGGGGGGASNIFTYQPSGTAAGNVYTSWSALMGARDEVVGPATIIIDDTFESPAVIDEGEWDLGNNTKVIGVVDSANGQQNRALVLIPPLASLQNSSEFENIRIRVSKWSTTIGGLHWTDPSLPVLLILRDAHLQDGQNGLSLGRAIYFSSTVNNTIEMYGNSQLENDDNYNPVFIDALSTLTIEVYDSGIVRDGVIVNDGSAAASIQVYSDGAFVDSRQAFATFVYYFTPGPIIYQYNGGGGGIQRVVTTWAGAVAAISTIPGPATIIVDDSITSPVPIDAGEWLLNGNTKIQGRKGTISTNNAVAAMTQMIVLDDAHIFNVYEFEDIIITGSSDTSPCFQFTSLMNIKAYSAIFRNEGLFPLFSVTNSSYADYHYFELFETSSINGLAGANVIGGDANGVYNIHLHDYATIEADTISLTGGVATLTININSIGCTYTLFQPQNTAIIEARVGYSNVITADNSLALGLNNLISGPDSTIGGGNTNLISAPRATISGGINNSITTEVGGTIGGGDSNSIGQDNGTIAGGVGNSVNTSGATVGGGFTNSSGGFGSTISGGGNNTTSGDYSTIPGGINGVTSRACQLTHAGGLFATSGDAQFGRYFVRGTSVAGAAQTLRDENLNEFQLFDGAAYSVRATCIANSLDTDERATFVRNMLVHGAGGAAIIDDDASAYDAPNGTSWSIIFTVSGSNVRATFTGDVGATVRAMVTYEWSEVGTL